MRPLSLLLYELWLKYDGCFLCKFQYYGRRRRGLMGRLAFCDFTYTEQSMAHTLPSRVFRLSRSHVEDRERFSSALPQLPLTFLDRTGVTKDPILTNVDYGKPGLNSKKKRKEIQERDRTTDTFKNGQPCRVMREPDRIASQAGILPSVIKRHISQLEDFHFLVRGVKASGLENNKGSRPNKRPKRKKEPWVKDSERERGWRSVLLFNPTPSAQRYHPEPQQRALSGRAFRSLLVEELVR